jgi:RNA polymerase I-specific transcription initiation factor RRN6
MAETCAWTSGVKSSEYKTVCTDMQTIDSSPRRNHDGTILAMYYKGTVKLTPGVGKVLSGASDAKTTDYGDSFVNFTFETGNEKYKELQNGTYVAAGHFVTGEGKPGVVVEYKVSKVVYKA